MYIVVVICKLYNTSPKTKNAPCMDNMRKLSKLSAVIRIKFLGVQKTQLVKVGNWNGFSFVRLHLLSSLYFKFTFKTSLIFRVQSSLDAEVEHFTHVVYRLNTGIIYFLVKCLLFCLFSLCRESLRFVNMTTLKVLLRGIALLFRLVSAHFMDKISPREGRYIHLCFRIKWKSFSIHLQKT